MPVKRKERIRSKDVRGGVQLMLTENLENIGNQGDIVRVKPGFARNYLLPMGLATVATEANKQMVESHRKRQDDAVLKKVADLREMAKKLKDYSVTLEANATEEGHLYGSIVGTDISKTLLAAGYPVQPEHVRLEGPLKELGMYTVKVHFHQDVETEVKVWVVPTASSIK